MHLPWEGMILSENLVMPNFGQSYSFLRQSTEYAKLLNISKNKPSISIKREDMKGFLILTLKNSRSSYICHSHWARGEEEEELKYYMYKR